MIFFNLRKPNLSIHLDPIIQAFSHKGNDVTIIYGANADIAKSQYREFGFNFINEDEVDKIDLNGITICADVHSKHPPNTYNLNTLHNQPVKYWGHPPHLLSRIDGFLCWGPFQKDFICHLYSRAGLIKPDLFETGCPLLDPLKILTQRRSKIFERHGISQNNHTVLFAPSWNAGLSLQDFGIEILSSLQNAPENLNIILRLHPASLFTGEHDPGGYFSGGESWSDLVHKLKQNKKNIFDFSNEPNHLEAIAISDTILTDVSSLAWDALTQDKNLFFLDCPNWSKVSAKNPNFFVDSEKLINNHDFLNGGRRYGNGVLDVTSLPTLLTSLSEHKIPGVKRKNCNVLIRRLLYNAWNSTVPTVDKILALHHQQITGEFIE